MSFSQHFAARIYALNEPLKIGIFPFLYATGSRTIMDTTELLQWVSLQRVLRT